MAICKEPRFVALLCCALVALAVSASAAAARPLATGIEQPNAALEDLSNAYLKIGRAGAEYVRIVLYWSDIAPTRPAVATNPADPAYRWAESRADLRIDGALAAGLTPLVTVWKAPGWAEDRNQYTGPAGTVKPSPQAFGDFAQALARRYPRVHVWEAWNEPNQGYFLSPQVVGGKVYSAGLYRQLLNRFAGGIHAVDPRDTVVGGGLAPSRTIPPLEFMRKLFCLSSSNKRVASCPTHLDAWSHHPYTNGGPFTKQGTPDGVSLGDLPRMSRTLKAASSSGNAISTKRSIAFWISEFSWDTDGPDPDAVPIRLHARWVSEALYQAWQSGVSLFVWHQLRDRPFPSTAYQSGLYFCGSASTGDDEGSRCAQTGFYSRDTAKTSSLLSFHFPFVAYARNGWIKVWGRTADSSAHRVVVERKVSGRWRGVKTLRAAGDGIFSARWSSADRSHRYRARVAPSGARSLQFSLRRPRAFALPATMWGCGGPIAC